MSSTTVASAASDSLQRVLRTARAQNRAALIGYLPAGFPTLHGSVAAMTAMVEAGCDAIEVGLPYSDPTMDGPTVQRAADLALAGGTRTREVLEVVREVADTGAAALVMSYWNPIDRYGVEKFVDDFIGAGGSGVITPDLIPDEAADWIAAARRRELNTVFLLAPSSTDARVAMTAHECRGFVYAASLMGVTGVRARVGPAAQALVARVRAVSDVPVAVGLGVSDGVQAAQVAAYSDGVIVGSAFVRCLLDAPDFDSGLGALRELTAELAAGVRSGRAA